MATASSSLSHSAVTIARSVYRRVVLANDGRTDLPIIAFRPTIVNVFREAYGRNLTDEQWFLVDLVTVAVRLGLQRGGNFNNISLILVCS